jgi:arylsulfatase A-like enzyme
MKSLATMAAAFCILGMSGLAAGQPNIVLILADDLGYGSVGSYGNKQVRTPHIDGLAATGIRCTDFHSSGPMCTPTRAALLTGRYPQRCAWVDDEQLSPVFRDQRRENIKQRWAWGISLAELTIADVLKNGGYATALIGKWHLGYDFKFHPMNQGFDEFRGFISGAVDYHSHVATSGLQQLDWWNGKEIRNDDGYATDLLTRYALDFISRHEAGPFFLFVSHAAPHVPLQGRDPNQQQSPAETYKEMIEVLDESVGAIVNALDDHGLRENTLILFCSDNGPVLPPGFPDASPFRGKKGSLLEGGHRVPAIINWPARLPSGKDCDVPLSTMDLFPTFARLAGVSPPRNHAIDGIDILPILKREAADPQRVLHWRFGNQWAVRRGDWKLIDGKTLYHLGNDPGESNNLAAEQPGNVEELHRLNREWTRDVGNVGYPPPDS